MEQASEHLVHRRYFEAEQMCVQSLRKALMLRDFDRVARIVLPLQEARRQKRDLAVDAGRTFLVTGELPGEDELAAGCYLVAPPRVGVDGRLLREAADRRHVPILVIVREPVTRDGLWPIVAVGPVTIRTKFAPPAPPSARAARERRGAPRRARGSGQLPAGKSKRSRSAGAATGGEGVEALPVAVAGTATIPAAGAAGGEHPDAAPIMPTTRWFIEASEALGDAAIAGIPASAPPVVRVDLLAEFLEAHPNHEKLHQRLEEAARAAARDPRSHRRSAPAMTDDDDEIAPDNGQDD